MRLENETSEIGRIAKAFQAIAKEISYEGLAKALLKAALDYCEAERGAVLLSEEGELLAKADASFSREKARFFVSQPSATDFQLSPDLSARVLRRQEIVVRQDSWKASALVDPAECPPGQNMAQLFVPLIHQDRTIGVLYLETEHEESSRGQGQ